MLVGRLIMNSLNELMYTCRSVTVTAPAYLEPNLLRAVTRVRLQSHLSGEWSGVEQRLEFGGVDEQAADVVAQHVGDRVELTVPLGAAQILDVVRGLPVQRYFGDWSSELTDQYASDEPNHCVVRHVARADGGLIRVRPGQVLPMLATIAAAFPTRAMAFVLRDRRAVNGVRNALKTKLGLRVVALGAGADDQTKPTVFIGTPGDLQHVQNRLNHDLRLVICLDAQTALNFHHRMALDAAVRAKLFGILPVAERLDWHDEQVLRDVYGFDDLTVLANGLAQRQGTVQIIRFRGGKPFSSWSDNYDLVREGVLGNARRNCRVATVARQVWDDADVRSCLVVAGDLVQAILLHRRLGWPILADALPVKPLGLSASMLAELKVASRCWLRIEGQAIATAAQLQQAPVHTFDAILIASGGNGLPEPLPRCLVERTETTRPAQVFDLSDGHDPRLRRHAKRRHADYRALGWTTRGPETMTDRIARFLTRRRNRS
jgi:hypothetical protein